MNEYSRVYSLFFHHGEVVEIRGLGLSGNNAQWEGWAGGRGIVSGYFDNGPDFARAAEALDAAGASGVYFTLNPCNADLIARSQNRLVAAGKKGPLTGDRDIKCVRWLPIDIDPRRAAGISSSQSELEDAKTVAANVKQWLGEEMGFPKPIGACSGNGYHILYRLPDFAPADDILGPQKVISRALPALNEKFGDNPVEIDLAVSNASRIWKLYGTMARKGDSTADRLHRKSYLFSSAPDTLDDVPVLSRALLDKLAELAPQDRHTSTAHARPPAASTSTLTKRMHPDDLGVLDVEAYLEHYGVDIKGKKEKGAAVFYLLEKCVFDPSHRGGDAAIVTTPDPSHLLYTCFHNSCKGRTWKQARARISGGEPIAPFFSNYNPNWQPPTEVGTGLLKSLTTAGSENKAGSPAVPGPDEIDPREFYQKRGKREVFTVAYMARYLAAWLDPIVHTDGIFWRYSGGVWSPFPQNSLNNIIHRALKDGVQAAWFKNSREVLAAAINREEKDWPHHENLVNLSNGMLDMEIMQLIEHAPKYGSRSQIPTPYEPEAEAECPRWLEFLDEIFPEGPEKKRLLQEFFGYVLMPTCRFEKALFMYGTGANGKSTVLKVLEEIVGERNVSHVSLDDLSHRFQVPYLKGRIVNIAAEVDTKEKAGTEVLKMAISGDTLEGEVKYGERVAFQSTTKFIFAMNSPPVIVDKSYGLSRRVVVLNFNRRFAPQERDRSLAEKLIGEKEGILAWAIEGARRLMANDAFTMSDDVERDTENFMASMNPVLLFLEEECIQGPSYKVPVTKLFDAYKTWCFKSAHRPLSKARFYEQIITQCQHVKEKKRIEWGITRPWGFEGIGLQR
ncbi:phage/plasmid primase, P4 family [Thermodesulfobacteriota bacterium]